MRTHTPTLFLPSFLVLHPLPSRLWLVASFLTQGAVAELLLLAIDPWPLARVRSCPGGLDFPRDVQPVGEAAPAAWSPLMRCKLFVMLPY